jgi:hypothetical protein
VTGQSLGGSSEHRWVNLNIGECICVTIFNANPNIPERYVEPKKSFVRFDNNENSSPMIANGSMRNMHNKAPDKVRESHNHKIEEPEKVLFAFEQTMKEVP